MESLLGYYPCVTGVLTRGPYRVREQCQVGSLTGAVASQRVTEAPKGTLRLDGNQSSSAIAEACLTVRQTSRTGTKVGNSDPAVPNGRAVAQRIKATSKRRMLRDNDFGTEKENGKPESVWRI